MNPNINIHATCMQLYQLLSIYAYGITHDKALCNVFKTNYNYFEIYSVHLQNTNLYITKALWMKSKYM